MSNEQHGVVVGCGSIGTRHIENLHALGVDAVAVEADHSRRREIADRYGVRTVSLSDALASDPTFVVVTVPTDQHVPIATRAARQKCHLFIEKPLSDTTHGVTELTSLVSECDLTTLVGCNMRFHPAIEHTRYLVDSGQVGDVLSVRIEAGSYLPEWRDEDYRASYSARQAQGGGAILDYIHEIDYARWLFGDVVEVSCFADHLSGLAVDVEDTAGLLVRFESGALGEIHVDYVQRTYSRSLHVIASEGTIRWHWDDNRVRWYSAATDSWTDEHYDDWTVNDMYLDELRHFLDCLDGHAQTVCDVADGRAALNVALAAKESASSGKHIRL